MVQRCVTISLPKSLSERLAPYKHRIKISKVCQEAILRKIDVIEKIDATGTDIDRTVTRLREERNYATSHFSDRGAEDAIKWTSTAEYEEIGSVIEVISEGKGIESLKYMKPVLRKMFSDYDVRKEKIPWDDDYSYGQWKNGFIRGIKEIWERVHKDVNE